MKDLTTIQQTVLDHIKSNPSASYADIAEAADLESKQSVAIHINALRLKGRLKKIPARWVVK